MSEDFEANKKTMEALADEGDNAKCADCGAHGTRWLTMNHGSHICIRCSGIHRSLGVHISKVKSASMDKITDAEVAVFRMMGNKVAKTLFEARLTPKERIKPEDNDNVVRDFIIAKYTDKKWAAPDWIPAMKKVFKTAGYKSGRKELKEKEQAAELANPAAASAAAAAADAAGKKSKSKTVKGKAAGVFGAVNVADDVHDERLVATLAAFGLSVAAAPAAAAADADGAAAAAASGGEPAEEPAAAQAQDGDAAAAAAAGADDGAAAGAAAE